MLNRQRLDRTDSEAPLSLFINTSLSYLPSPLWLPPGNPLHILHAKYYYTDISTPLAAAATALYNARRRRRRNWYPVTRALLYAVLSSSTSKRWWNIERHTPLTPFTQFSFPHPVNIVRLKETAWYFLRRRDQMRYKVCI